MIIAASGRANRANMAGAEVLEKLQKDHTELEPETDAAKAIGAARQPISNIIVLPL